MVAVVLRRHASTRKLTAQTKRAGAPQKCSTCESNQAVSKNGTAGLQRHCILGRTHPHNLRAVLQCMRQVWAKHVSVWECFSSLMLHMLQWIARSFPPAGCRSTFNACWRPAQGLSCIDDRSSSRRKPLSSIVVMDARTMVDITVLSFLISPRSPSRTHIVNGFRSFLRDPRSCYS